VIDFGGLRVTSKQKNSHCCDKNDAPLATEKWYKTTEGKHRGSSFTRRTLTFHHNKFDNLDNRNVRCNFRDQSS
jgi:hypothetical protein